MPLGPRFTQGLFQEHVQLALGHAAGAEVLVDRGQDLGERPALRRRRGIQVLSDEPTEVRGQVLAELSGSLLEPSLFLWG
jgi:hypothetical protein